MRQQGTLDAATPDSDDLAVACTPHPTGARSPALLRIALARHCSRSVAAGAEGTGRIRNPLGCSLVALVEAARLVSRGTSISLEIKEAER